MEKHLAIFKGLRYRKVYCFDRYQHGWCYSEPSFYPSKELLGSEVFLEKEVDYPPIKKGEQVYIKEIDQIVVIDNRIRNLDGGYIYETTYCIEEIKDEATEKSYNRAKQEEKEYNEEKQSKEDNIKESLMEIFTPAKKWYQFWK